MYDVALAVSACLRAGTRADVAWLVDSEGVPVADWTRAVAFTPGGGRIGGIDGGAIDARIADVAGRSASGRLVELELTEVDALISGLGAPGRIRAVVSPADSLPPRLWELATERGAFCLVSRLDGDEVTESALYSDENLAADDEVAEVWNSGAVGSVVLEGRIISVFRAAPRVVVVGPSPVADAVESIAEILGWEARSATSAGEATGMIASLSTRDKVVVAAHDLEVAGAALLAALESGAGYIGSMGSRRMQENRADWLAYRGVTDLERVRGPAGLDIAAAAPGEIAVAIVAEMIAQSPRT